MKHLTKQPYNLNRIEFWASTTIFVFAVFFLVAKATGDDINALWTTYKHDFNRTNTPYSFYENYFFPQIFRYSIFYSSFLLLNFITVPAILERKPLVTHILLGVLVFFALGLTLGVTDTYLKTYLLTEYKDERAAYNFIFQKSFAYACWLMLMFGFYSFIKYAAQYLLLNSKTIQSRYEIVTSEGLIAFVLWMISIFLSLISNLPNAVISVWFVIIPFGICLYWYSFYMLIPKALMKKKPFSQYLWKVFIVMLLSVLPIMLLTLLIFNDKGLVPVIILFNAGFQLLITAPLSWIVYKRRTAENQQVVILQTALGRSNARLDFLRSQINPHFLFNALNTLYGTAIQESAERTGEGIQRLGDMMRFMLQENMQETISLNREIEYINNYISLQKLRTNASPQIIVQTEIEDPISDFQIAPMLLIPFVENAFKHGISLREPSHIRITLQLKGNQLFFDVNNSIHRSDADPENNKSGIGLNNVEQRLKLLYPNRHELIIRETAKEFYIHLTIQLTTKDT